MPSKDLETRRRHNRESYHRNKEKRKLQVIQYQEANPEKSYLWKRKWVKRKTQEFEDFKKTLFCSKCGEDHVSCLEFHHVDPSKKEGLISKLRFSKLKLAQELKKCIVLCSNCHRKLHYGDKIKNQELCLTPKKRSYSARNKNKLL